MGYTYYNPLKVWLDPASIADVVSYMQKYLSENPIKDTEEINQIIAEYIAAHPELIGGVQSVNGETGEVVLTASDINTTGTTTIQAVLTSLSSQISEITQTVSQNTDDITDLKSALPKALTNLQIISSYNKWNPDNVTSNANIETNPSDLGAVISGNYNVSELIPVSKGETIQYYYSAGDTPPTAMSIGTSVFRLAEYDKDENCLLVSSNWQVIPYTVQNQNTYYIRFAIPARNWNMITVDDERVAQKPFVAYAPNINLQTYLSQFLNPIELVLPSTLYGVAGQEINIYKENLFLYNRLNSITYLHTRMPNDAVQNSERTIWNPSANSLTENNYKWEFFDTGTKDFPTIKTIKVCTVPKDTGSSTIKVLIIGDSKVANGYVSYHFLHNFDDDNMTCTLLGTQYDWQTDNRNEGYGGKNAKWFCENSSSPFSNNGEFDFSNYLTTNTIDTPDYVFINLGTNDSSGQSGSSDAFVTSFVNYITQMITSIHSVSPSIKVIIGLCEGGSTAIDTNNAEFMIWDFNQKIQRLHKGTIESFDNRQDENIYVCPMYMGMDLTQDYNMTEVPLSQRDGDMNNGQGDGKTRMQITDRIHQNEVGYWKNADYMYALVKYIVAKSIA